MALHGLTAAEVKERAAAGKANDYETRHSRSYADIVIKNFFTTFNIILFILGAALIVCGELISAASATGVIIMNVLISTVQEIKAKRRLDKIALLLRPKVLVMRDDQETDIDRGGLVIDDLVHLGPGDQAQVDGTVETEHQLEMDESPLTGESHTCRRHVSEPIYSGAFCVAGDCWFRVTAVGRDTFSSKMLATAQKFEKKNTPLQTETGTVTKLLMTIAFVYLFIIILVNIVLGKPLVASLNEAVIVLDIVPIALFLLITLTYMIAAVRMADSGVLLQNSSSVESMSHVNTVCMDKTGTITTNHLVFQEVQYLTDDHNGTDTLIARFAASTASRNRTVTALADRFPDAAEPLADEIQFSSERKFSAVKFASDGITVVMGAWPFLRDRAANPDGVQERLTALSAQGFRSVVICSAGTAALHAEEETVIPPLTVLAIVAIRDEVRPDCKEILSEFTAHGMDVKVISGDDPETVDAIFSLAQIPGERRILSGEQLAQLSDTAKDKTIMQTNIFGRMKPEQKEEVIESLRRQGRYVAMVGDGVNDVRSIKKAQVGVALQSGSGAARGVADMILANDDFRALPKAIVEGKRTVSGMRDILKLYLVRNFTLSFLVLFLLIMLNRIPMMPVQNTYYALETVSFAAFLLTIWARPSENKDLILPNVMRYVLPMSVLISFFALSIYTVFYIGTNDGWIDLSASYDWMAQRMGWSSAELLDHLSTGGHPDIAEINARNAMIMFLVMSGIAQLFLLFPLSKHWSPDRQRTDDIRPTLLALVLYGVMALMFCIPEISIGIASLIEFPADYILLFIGITAVWFVLALIILRNPRMNWLADWIDRYMRRKLEVELQKETAGTNQTQEKRD